MRGDRALAKMYLPPHVRKDCQNAALIMAPAVIRAVRNRRAVFTSALGSTPAPCALSRIPGLLRRDLSREPFASGRSDGSAPVFTLHASTAPGLCAIRRPSCVACGSFALLPAVSIVGPHSPVPGFSLRGRRRGSPVPLVFRHAVSALVLGFSLRSRHGMSTERSRREFASSLVAGSVAGTAVDVVLFPLDTAKTRLQSPQGFWKSGGFKGMYKGLSAAAAGSAPGAALFFGTYTLANAELHELGVPLPEPMIHMASASCGEVAACIVRVPTEVVKQRMQAGRYSRLSIALNDIVSKHGVGGLFRGYMSTLAREIPFALIQFPLYEQLKKAWAWRVQRKPKPWEAALAGSLAGGVAACLTTPFDVCKTRIMLGSDPSVRLSAAAVRRPNRPLTAPPPSRRR